MSGCCDRARGRGDTADAPGSQRTRAGGAAGVVMLALALSGCEEAESPQDPSGIDGDPTVGAALIRQYGCPSCHTIPGIRGAVGIVGPSLRQFARRAYIGGVHPNTPDNLVNWIMNAPGMSPATAMPDMDVPEDRARHIAAYLQTLR